MIGSNHLSTVLGDDAQVDIATRAEIVEDTGSDGVGDELFGLFLAHAGLVAVLEYGHGGERARAHSHVRRAVARTVWRYGCQVRSSDVYAAENESRAHVALVAEEVLTQQAIGRHHANLTARVQSVQLQLRGNHSGCEWRVRSCSRTAATFNFSSLIFFNQLEIKNIHLLDIWGDVVDFLALFFGYDIVVCGSRISSQDNTILKKDTRCI